MRKGKALRNKRPLTSASLNITSLMDVLTIILIFLLVNYTDSVQETDIPKGLNLPQLQSKEKGTLTEDVKVFILRDRVLVGDRVIPFSSFEAQKVEISRSFAEFLYQLNEQKKNEGKTTRVSLRADRSIPYSVIDELLVAAGAAGVNDFDLLALIEED